MTAKQQALTQIARLPDDISAIKIIESLVLRASIDMAIADVNQGNWTSHEDVMAKMDQWLESDGLLPQNSTSNGTHVGSLATPS
jgi:predicted transcriptional regulator